ncbi:MAG: hypothetical protein ACI9Y7_002777, partial [Dokdonia sp.]
MNRSHLCIALLITAMLQISCMDRNSQKKTKDMAISTNATQKKLSENRSKKAIKHLPIPDYQRNMVMALLPVPESWNFYKGNDPEIFLEGPGGIKAFYIRGNTFMYSPNGYINQSAQQMGWEVKPFEPLENTVQLLHTSITSQGGKFLNQYHLPQFERAAYAFEQQIFKAIPEQKSFKVIATEWEDKNGIRSLIIIQHYYAQTQESYNWGYNLEAMEAPSAIFKTATQDFLNAKLNIRMNTQWVTAVNNQNRQQSRQTTEGHIKRMGDLRAQGQQIINNGKQHDAMTTRNHQKFMDGLNDQITVTSPSSGQN